MLRSIADIRTLSFVFSYFLFTALAWLYFDKMTSLVQGVVVAGLCVSSFLCAVIVHNVIHVPIFRNRRINAVFQIILTLT
ncbi:MAG: hypothetical protein GY816_05570 [Cytophagales bacterium]|nr:hypothetical protein [Cytophagales bacterium]